LQRKIIAGKFLGGKIKMKRRFVITWALAVGLFGLAAVVEAEEPFVHLSTTPDKIDLGTAPFANSFDVPAALTVNVEANCIHGPIMISSTELKHSQGVSISPERIFVKSPATEGFIAMARPVVISKPTIGSHKVVLDLRVETDFLYPAGEYSGTLMLTIMPPV
jgi:hypothetical protein